MENWRILLLQGKKNIVWQFLIFVNTNIFLNHGV